LWKEPLKFDPDRHLTKDEDTSGKNSLKYMAFGYGIRRCVGEHLGLQEAATVVTMILRSFDFELCENQKITDEDFSINFYFFCSKLIIV